MDIELVIDAQIVEPEQIEARDSNKKESSSSKITHRTSIQKKRKLIDEESKEDTGSILSDDVRFEENLNIFSGVKKYQSIRLKRRDI